MRSPSSAFGLLGLVLGLGACSESSEPGPPSSSGGSSNSRPSDSGAAATAGVDDRDGITSQGGRPQQGNAGETGVAGSSNSAGNGSADAGSSTGMAAGGSGGGIATEPACPPPGPYANTSGSVAANVKLFDCDGNAVMLHELCANEVSAIYTFAAWCPVCKAHMVEGLPNELLSNYGSKGLVEWVVVTEDASGDPASAQLCGITRDTYSLTPRVLFDAGNELHSKVGVQVNSGGLVLSAGAVIEHNQGYEFDALEAKVAELLP